MPSLPTDRPEPFAAVLGIMLYPGTDQSDQRKALAFASQNLALPVRCLQEAGFQLPHASLQRIVMDAGTPLDDIDERWRLGLEMGDLFKAICLLARDRPDIASWENAIRIYERCAVQTKARASRSKLWLTKRRFISVAPPPLGRLEHSRRKV